LALVPLNSVGTVPTIGGEPNPQQGGTLPQSLAEWEVPFFAVAIEIPCVSRRDLRPPK